jgi:3-isopropylmalate/(R)-2-methylmalate dehydratase small subunit
MRVWKFGRNIDTDVIVTAKYLNSPDPAEYSKHLMEASDNEDFKRAYGQGKGSVIGDVFVADRNFGCGSSRTHAPNAIKFAGITYVIAPTFARIFYRNAFNIGMPLIECPDAEKIQQGDNIEVLVNEGLIRVPTRDEVYRFSAIPEFMQKLIESGGVVEFRAREMGYKRRS